MSSLWKRIYDKMIKYKDLQDNIVEVEGRLFVTKDSLGKDVFAGDKIKALYLWPDAKNPQTITGKVGWRDETFNWVLYHTPNTPECADLYQLFDIELIEGKEDV